MQTSLQLTPMDYTLAQTLSLWAQSSDAQGQQSSENTARDLKNLRSTLKLYVLEALNFQTREMQTNEFAQFAEKLTLKQWMQGLKQFQTNSNATPPLETLEQPDLPTPSNPEDHFVEVVLALFDQQFDAAIVAERVQVSTKRNYRSVLGRYLKWIVEQTWWSELFPRQLPAFLPQNVPRGLRKSSPQKRPLPYALKEHQLSPQLQEELVTYKDFRISGGKKSFRQWLRQNAAGREGHRPQLEPVMERSFERKEKQFILQFLGWCVNIQGEALETLTLEHLTDLERLQNYVEWLVDERKRTHATGCQLTAIAIAIAKWKHYHQTQRRNWSDIPIIQTLRDLRTYYGEEYKAEKLMFMEAKWQSKELTHQQAQQIVQYLRQLCAPFGCKVSPSTGQRVKGHRRSNSAIVQAWQIYLIVKLLVYLPVRQQEIRQLKLGTTLLRKLDASGKPYYEAVISDHKLKSKTRKNRHYRIPAVLTQDLEAWIQVWRPKAIEAVRSVDDWLAFWGYPPNQLQRLEQRLGKAHQGQLPIGTQPPEAYSQSLEQKIRQMQQLIATWETAKHNVANDPPLFFSMGGSNHRTTFGHPFESANFCKSFQLAIAKASRALFGQSKWTNPHAMRHIAAKHIRLIKGDGNTLAKLMGHSSEMGQAYAEQIFTDYEQTESFVDDWWEAH